MTLPTDSQWARYSALCAHLQPLPPAARQAQLAAWQDAGTADPQVLSLVALHYALPPDADRDRTGERLGPFTLEAPLGAGGMGIVYRAQQHLGLSTRPVAVKLIHPALLRTAREEALARFQAELGALARLEHEGIARLYDGGIGEDPHTHAPLPYIAMELVRGGLPLTTYARDYALTWPERLALVVRVCHAVRYAHEHRVIHRDLKPANILVDSEGRPVVLDFGLAQACDAVLPGAPLAASGTPAYMSPEQVSAVWGAVSAKSDVYALGLMLYELLTGHHPYAQLCDGSAAQLGHVLTAVMLPPLRQSHPAYGEELEAVLAAALAKRPAERCAVAVLRSRLERYLQQQPPASDRLQADPRPAQQARTGMAVGARPPAAERRQLTILFCDLVDSTTVAGQLDPEDWREVVLAYHATCTGVISRYAGHTAQHLGDGLLVYFGYPAAHEDDAQRAVRTGVEILAALAPLNARLLSSIQARLPHPVQVRIGVHTGVVVIGEIGSSDKREMLALGETPNIAARVQGCAAPDTVVVSAATHRLVHGLFECQELGPQTLKGLATPLLLYRVIAESAAQSRFEVAVGRGLTPLVGREAELSLLRRRWEQAQEGAGQVVLLSGEAGIGKSRLVQTLKEQVSGEQAPRIELRCSPYHQHSAFYPLIDHLQRFLQFAPHDPPQTKLVKLHQALARYRFPHADTLPLLAALLSLPHPAGTPPLPLSPQQQKHKTQEALVAWIIEEAEHAAVYCAWEDLHWADPSSLELLTLYLEHIPTSRVFTVLTFRPDFTPPWGPRSYLTHLTLNRLGRQQVETLVDKVTRGKALPSEVLQQIVAKTDGVPLFVEELTKMVLESGVLQEEEDRYVRAHGQRQGQADGAPIPPLTIPSTLHDSLMARLDRLAPVREIAQVGAVLGREFTYELIHGVSPVDEITLQQGLRQFVEAELLYQRGLPPQTTYFFKHALIQDAAYQSLLKSRRQQLHQQIAQVVADRFPETVETQPEFLAHHYTEAGFTEQAIPYWQRAGERALGRSANLEAIAHLTKGLEVLNTLPDSLERTRQELDVQTTLGPALIATQGFAAAAVEQTYARARELCERVEQTPQLSRVLTGLGMFYVMRGELQKGRELAEQLLRLAERVHEPVLRLLATTGQGSTLFLLGELGAARAYLEQGMALYDPQQHRAHALLYGLDHGVNAFSHAAQALWLLGYPDQALRRSEEALTLAQGLAHLFSRVLTMIMGADVHRLRREWPLVQERAEAALTLSTEQGFALWVARGMIVRGWALVAQGQREAGIAHMHQGLVAYQATGAKRGQPSFLALLAEAYGNMGQAEAGLRALAEALAIVHTTGERWGEAEIYRLKGELLLLQATGQGGPENAPIDPSLVAEAEVGATGRLPRQAEAETCFQQALAIAQRQQAKSWELRAAMSLARLWQQQGKRTEAHDLLAPIYGWFTEGFDTADLQEAKALLEDLGG